MSFRNYRRFWVKLRHHIIKYQNLLSISCKPKSSPGFKIFQYSLNFLIIACQGGVKLWSLWTEWPTLSGNVLYHFTLCITLTRRPPCVKTLRWNVTLHRRGRVVRVSSEAQLFHPNIVLVHLDTNIPSCRKTVSRTHNLAWLRGKSSLPACSQTTALSSCVIAVKLPPIFLTKDNISQASWI